MLNKVTGCPWWYMILHLANLTVQLKTRRGEK